MKSSLSIISFIDHVFGVVAKMSSPHSRLSRFSPMLYPRRFIVLRFTSRSMIHHKFSFVKSVRSMTRFFFFFFCMQMSSCSSTICRRDYLCSIILLLLLCWRLIDCIYGSRSKFYKAEFTAQSPGELLSKCSLPGPRQNLLSRILWESVWGICLSLMTVDDSEVNRSRIGTLYS